MLENIGHDGYQAGLDYMIGGNEDTSGIAIWHIDENQSGNSDYTHKLVDLEEAADAGLDLGSHNGKPVSNTHLRAHETRHEHVCRLLHE